jgi:hypothetical protein
MFRIGHGQPGEGAMREVDVPAPDDAASRLAIATETVCFLIARIREVNVKDLPADPESGSNPTDDRQIGVVEDQPDDPAWAEITGTIDGLNVDEQIDLVAMMWLGRGDGGVDDWEQLRAEAARLHTPRTGTYLLGHPLLADHLEEALAQFGQSCADVLE